MLSGAARVALLLVAVASSAAAQNLAPNPGFESFSTCPNAAGEPYDGFVDDWTTPTNATSNYFNACATGQWTVPGGAFFGPAAHGGNAYSGLYAYATSVAGYREYVEAPLDAPLVAGAAYAVSFWVHRASGSRYGVDRIGAHFALGSVGPVATTTTLLLTPQVESPAGTVLDGGWVLVSGTFVAAGGEDHVVIGSFRDDAATAITDFAPCSCVSGAYYYVDDVRVARATLTAPVPAWTWGAVLLGLALLGCASLRGRRAPSGRGR